MRASLTGPCNRFSPRGSRDAARAPTGRCRRPVQDLGERVEAASGPRPGQSGRTTGTQGSDRHGRRPARTSERYPTLRYADARAAIRQLTEAFGFAERAVYEGEDGSVAHAELVQGNGAVMLGSKGRGGRFDEAMGSGGVTGVYVVVADIDAHHRRAVERRRGDPDAPDRPGIRLARLHGPRIWRATSGASGRTRRRYAGSLRRVRPPGGCGALRQLPPVWTWKAARRTALQRGIRVRGGEGDQDLHGAGVRRRGPRRAGPGRWAAPPTPGAAPAAVPPRGRRRPPRCRPTARWPPGG
ncbi:hypothetical protein STENM223S_08284 [Streptomyces tendae]